MNLNAIIRILFLILISGILAYIGDTLGFKIGKKRISLFGLRPRNTARVVTVFIGIFIMIITLTFASLISKDVRIALFNIDNLIKHQRELADKNRLLLKKIEALKKRSDVLKKEIEQLQLSINEKIKKIQVLEGEILKKQKGKLAFTAGEIIGYRLLKYGLKDDEIVNEFKKLIKQIIAISKAKGAKPRAFSVIWKGSSKQRKQLIEFYKNIVKKEDDSVVLIVKCTKNVFFGDNLGNILFNVEKNRIILKKGYTFALKDFEIDGKISRNDIALFLRYFFNKLKAYLKSMGLINSEVIKDIDFYDYVNYIKSTNDRMIPIVYFTDNLYLYDPNITEKYKVMFEKIREVTENESN